MNTGEIRIGTSGFSYKSWVKTFYPASVTARRHFEYYGSQFTTVEINLTFYRLPTSAMVNGWLQKAPPGFVYAIKGSRFITHMKKLSDLGESLDRFFEALRPMRSVVGPILWQLPPNLGCDIPRLERFLRQLPAYPQYVFEFRDPSWLVPATFRILEKHEAGFVSVSSLKMPVNFTVTSDIVYIRFHGLEGGFAHDYTCSELEPWARHMTEQSAHGRKVFAYFNNDGNARAPENARLLVKMTGGS
jgi:uncharacterized protein YecE (DUF72 family)